MLHFCRGCAVEGGHNVTILGPRPNYRGIPSLESKFCLMEPASRVVFPESWEFNRDCVDGHGVDGRRCGCGRRVRRRSLRSEGGFECCKSVGHILGFTVGFSPASILFRRMSRHLNKTFTVRLRNRGHHCKMRGSGKRSGTRITIT